MTLLHSPDNVRAIRELEGGDLDQVCKDAVPTLIMPLSSLQRIYGMIVVFPVGWMFP